MDIALPSTRAGVKTRRANHVIGRVALYATLAVGVVLFAYPFVWMVTTSLKPASDVFEFPPSLVPKVWEWSNYPNVLTNFPFAQGLANTLIIILGVEVGRLISVPLAAYAFA